MSYDLAVWEGPPPLSNMHAGSECERRLATPEPGPPTPPVAAFIEAMVEIFPRDRPGGPWIHDPADGAAGTMAYLTVDRSRLSEVVPAVQASAARLLLVAFDPQAGELIPSAVTVDRSAEFDLPDRAEFPIHLAAVIGEALAAGTTMAGIVEQVENGFYVQWMVKDGGLTVEAQGEGVLPPTLRLPDEGRDRMMGLGFVLDEPNWSLHWADGDANAEEAARILADVFTTVRALPPGTAMKLQTFPV